MREFSSKQIKSLVVLQIVTGLLIIGILFLPWLSPFYADADDATTDTTTETEHNIYRSARVATDSVLSFETNIGGSQNESVVASYPTSGGIIIFVNTSSSDLDFSSGVASYAVMLDSSGKIVSIIPYGGNIECVVPYDDGYLLCVNSESESGVIAVDFLGNQIKYTTITTNANERVIDLYLDYFNAVDTEPYHVVIEYTSTLTQYKEIKIIVLSDLFEVSYEVVFVRSQSLEYICAYSHSDGFYMFANLVGYSGTLLTYYNWADYNFNEDMRSNLEIASLPSYTCDHIIPIGSDRYALFVSTPDNVSYLLDCYNSFEYYSIIPLGYSATQTTSLFCDNEYIYTYSYSTGDISSIYRLDYDMNIVDKLTSFNSLSALYCHTVTPYGTLLAGQKNTSAIVAGINSFGVSYEVSFLNKTATFSNMIYSQDSIFMVGICSATSENVGDNFGLDDIYVVKLTL